MIPDLRTPVSDEMEHATSEDGRALHDLEAARHAEQYANVSHFWMLSNDGK